MDWRRLVVAAKSSEAGRTSIASVSYFNVVTRTNRGYHTRFQHKCLESEPATESVAVLNDNNPPASSAVWVIRWIVWTGKTS